MFLDMPQLGQRILDVVYGLSPYRTGNLRDNGLSTIGSISESEAYFTLNRGGYAPYGLLLNENKRIAYKRKDGSLSIKNNAHYQWFDNALAAAVETLAVELGGIVEC